MDYEEFAEYLSENYDLYSNSEIAKFLNVKYLLNIGAK